MLSTGVLLFVFSLVLSDDGFYVKPAVERAWRCIQQETVYPVSGSIETLLEELERLDSKTKENVMPWQDLLIFENALARVYQVQNLMGSTNEEGSLKVDRSYVILDWTVPGIRHTQEFCKFETPEVTKVLLKTRKRIENERKTKDQALKPADSQGETTEKPTTIKKKALSKADKAFAYEIITMICVLTAVLVLCNLTMGYVKFNQLNNIQIRRRLADAGENYQIHNDDSQNNEENSKEETDSGEVTAIELESEDDTQCETESEEDESSDDSFEKIEL